jgi:DNA-directed RNA polymerase specialized sigma24 family protein
VRLSLGLHGNAQLGPPRGHRIFFLGGVRVSHRIAHRPMMAASNRKKRGLIGVEDSATPVSRALASLSEADLLRLQALARLRARGLPRGVSWSDLLHEAIARALDGSRQWPPGLPFSAFISGVMRSICHELWGQRGREAERVVLEDDVEVACSAPNQERVLAAAQAIAAIQRLFRGDQVALQIMAGLANGLSAEEIRNSNNLSLVQYHSARRRMRRALIRIGLTGSAP